MGVNPNSNIVRDRKMVQVLWKSFVELMLRSIQEYRQTLTESGSQVQPGYMKRSEQVTGRVGTIPSA